MPDGFQVRKERIPKLISFASGGKFILARTLNK